MPRPRRRRRSQRRSDRLKRRRPVKASARSRAVPGAARASSRTAARTPIIRCTRPTVRQTATSAARSPTATRGTRIRPSFRSAAPRRSPSRTGSALTLVAPAARTRRAGNRARPISRSAVRILRAIPSTAVTAAPRAKPAASTPGIAHQTCAPAAAVFRSVRPRAKPRPRTRQREPATAGVDGPRAVACHAPGSSRRRSRLRERHDEEPGPPTRHLADALFPDVRPSPIAIVPRNT